MSCDELLAAAREEALTRGNYHRAAKLLVLAEGQCHTPEEKERLVALRSSLSIDPLSFVLAGLAICIVIIEVCIGY